MQKLLSGVWAFNILLLAELNSESERIINTRGIEKTWFSESYHEKEFKYPGESNIQEHLTGYEELTDLLRFIESWATVYVYL